MSTELSNNQLAYVLELICNRLQITPTQYSSAKEKYGAVGNWLGDEASPLHKYQPVIYPQGSFRIGTTVRPLEREEYDVDLVCQLSNDADIVDPMKLLNDVYEHIVSNDLYKSPIAEKKNRCVCINYKGDFHLDILPARSDPQGDRNHILVPDKKTKEWKASNPIGYAEWFEEKAKVLIKLLEAARIEPLPRYQVLSDKLPLQQTVQLLKRWSSLTFKDNADSMPPSIVLTTLAARNYNKDLLVTVSLSRVLDGILLEIKNSDGPLEVLNPTNDKECLSEKWIENPKRYYAFSEALVKFKKEWDDLFQGGGIPLLTSKLIKLFGENVVKSSINDFANDMQNKRKSEELGVDKSGILTGLGATMVKVKPNTFYGI